jgi:uncharacterized protein (DUF885 family)
MKNYHALRKPVSVLILGLVAAITISAKPRTFHEIVDAYFDDYFKANPSAATSVGFHQYDNELEKFSLAAHEQTRQRLQKYLAEFEVINPQQLSPLDRDDREIMISTIHSALLEEERVQMWHLLVSQTEFRRAGRSIALGY